MEPLKPILTPGLLAVRLLDIAQVATDSPSLTRDLSTHDETRAARFRFPEDRCRFLAGRALLRRSIKELFGSVPGVLEFNFDSNGRPSLKNRPKVVFNISHAGDLVAVVVSHRTSVGIDVERTSAKVNLIELAKRIFSESDWQQFESMPEHEKPAAFYQAWTGKEAWLKARGLGIAAGLRETSVPLRPNLSPHMLPPVKGDLIPWSVQSLALPSGYAGNVVWNDPGKTPQVAWIDPATL